jgi:hypothetical protein
MYKTSLTLNFFYIFQKGQNIPFKAVSKRDVLTRDIPCRIFKHKKEGM